MTGIIMSKVIAILVIISPITAHICLISPQQRGKIDISSSGSRTCFKHGFPCGGDAPQTPMFILSAGQPAFIKWQQNYNHYEPGYPGYMDISIGPIKSSSPDEWTTLGVISDKYVFAQDYQHNYTAIVNVPNKACDHCVIRVRYNAHKPGETTFYQCSDVRVSATHNNTNSPLQFPLTDTRDQSLIRAVRLTHQKSDSIITYSKSAPTIYGQAYDPFNTSRVTYVQFDPKTGDQQNVISWNFGVAINKKSGANIYKYITDEVLTVDPTRQSIVAMFHGSGSRDNVPSELIEIGVSNGSILNQHTLRPAPSSAINSMVYWNPGQYLTFTIQEDSSNVGNYYFVVGVLSVSGTWKELGRTPNTENLFVNFQWMVFDNQNNILYLLLGNENAADSLDARIYSYTINTNMAIYNGFVNLMVSSFTFMSMHYYQETDKVLAISPGLFSAIYPAYRLIEIDVKTGAVTKLLQVTPPGIFEKYYGGTVINGIDQNAGIFTQVFRVADSQADVIASINLKTLTVKFSQLTNLRHVHNLVYIPSM